MPIILFFTAHPSLYSHPTLNSQPLPAPPYLPSLPQAMPARNIHLRRFTNIPLADLELVLPVGCWQAGLGWVGR